MDHISSTIPPHVLPSMAQLEHARSSLYTALPPSRLSFPSLQQHLTQDIVPGFNAPSQSSRYYGFVTGGATPASQFADNLVTQYDQNVQVHLPRETIATEVEDAALRMLCQLLDFSAEDWRHRTFTTGATASNVLGLAMGREFVIAEAGKRKGVCVSVAETGLMQAVRVAQVDEVQILTTVPHSSIRKAASVIGLGHAAVKDVSQSGIAHRFDHALLEEALKKPRTASIIMISCAEVNTGFFATDGSDEMTKIRALANQYGAWIHVDAAFGLLARVLPDDAEFTVIKRGVAGLELADSVAGDGHKGFNVPYDTGIFISRHLALAQTVFQNPGAPYLSAALADIPSPLNIGLENSRRFRALPMYANLVIYGKEGYKEMLMRQIRLARRIATLIKDSDEYELLPLSRQTAAKENDLENIFIVVLFRAKDEQMNEKLVRRINGSREVYVSGTKWDGKAAARFAISNWKVDEDRDWPVIQRILETVAAWRA